MIQAKSVWLLAVLSLSTLCFAQTVQDNWINPSLPDESITLTIGSTYNITWNGDLYNDFQYYAPSANVTNVDLYFTGSYQTQFAHLVASNVNVVDSLFIRWRVSVPSDELAQTPYWTFRFIAANSTWSGANGEQISSPRVIVQSATNTTANGGNGTMTDTTSTGSSSDGGLSGGAIAGIVIGVLAAVVIVAGLLWFFLRRRKSAAATTNGGAPGNAATEPLQPLEKPTNDYYTPGVSGTYKSAVPPSNASSAPPYSPAYQQQHLVELPTSVNSPVQLP